MLVDVVGILACFVVIAEALYLHAVQTILLVNAYRKVINSPVYEDYMDYLDHYNSTTADSQLEYDDFVRQLNQMLAKLPKTQQEIIRLSKLEMLNNQEIAEKLNYSEQTVKNQLSMGLKQLRQLISNRTNLMWLLFLV